jgi:hypothetical protein
MQASIGMLSWQSIEALKINQIVEPIRRQNYPTITVPEPFKRDSRVE